jgi:hypothetical protein
MDPLLFKITDVGLSMAAAAQQKGIRIKLTTFRCASSFGYTLTGAETALQGDILYTDNITRYLDQPDGTVILVCTINVQAGPFDFGEIGLFLEDGTLFALAVLDQLQHKYSSLGGPTNTTFTFNCHLRLKQGTAIFKFTQDTFSADTTYVESWAQVLPSRLLPEPRATRLIVREMDAFGNNTGLDRKEDGNWTISSTYHSFPYILTPVNRTVDYFDISLATWQMLVPGDVTYTLAKAGGRTFVLKCDNIYRKAIVYNEAGVARFRFTQALTTIPTAPFLLYIDDSSLLASASISSFHSNLN